MSGRIEIITGPERRRPWSNEEKLQLVEEGYAASKWRVGISRRTTDALYQGKKLTLPGSSLIFFACGELQGAPVIPASREARGMGLPPSILTVSFAIRRRSIVLPLFVAAGGIQRMWRVCGTGVLMSKAACAVLVLVIPGFLGYPAALNVDRLEKKSSQPMESVSVKIWPAPVTVVSLQPRWLITQAPTAQYHDGDVLTKELQRQLRRVGCYDGEINGVWTQSTRRAMQSFTNRVNARLPIERPDHILLAMLQTHPDSACKKPCPFGENSGAGSRCVPGAIASLPIKTAALSRAKQPLVTSWTATETPAPDDYVPPKPARAPLITATARSPPAPKIVVVPPPKQSPPQRPVVTATNRAPRAQPRTFAQSERAPSRPIHQTEFVRTLFQRLDGAAR